MDAQTQLIVGLSVGLGVGLLLLIALAICVAYQHEKMKKDKRRYEMGTAVPSKNTSTVSATPPPQRAAEVQQSTGDINPETGQSLPLAYQAQVSGTALVPQQSSSAVPSVFFSPTTAFNSSAGASNPFSNQLYPTPGQFQLGNPAYFKSTNWTGPQQSMSVDPGPSGVQVVPQGYDNPQFHSNGESRDDRNVQFIVTDGDGRKKKPSRRKESSSEESESESESSSGSSYSDSSVKQLESAKKKKKKTKTKKTKIVAIIPQGINQPVPPPVQPKPQSMFFILPGHQQQTQPEPARGPEYDVRPVFAPHQPGTSAQTSFWSAGRVDGGRTTYETQERSANIEGERGCGVNFQIGISGNTGMSRSNYQSSGGDGCGSCDGGGGASGSRTYGASGGGAYGSGGGGGYEEKEYSLQF